MSDLAFTLESPPRYTSIIGERFRIEPGLHPFPTDFGQGKADERIFQIDAAYSRYLRDKHLARQRRPSQFYCEHEFSAAVQAAVCHYIVNQLVTEHPNYFTLRRQNDQLELHNGLQDTQLSFAAREAGLEWQPDTRHSDLYSSGLDALAMQLQEDLVVLSRNGDRHWVSAIHLCFPNHWSAPAKIGRPFSELHEPVPHFDRIAARETQLVDAMVDRGPYVRFAWGLSADDRLEHHPQAHTPRFDPTRPKLYLRVERQCIVGLAAQDCALFTIRTYYYDVNSLRDRTDLLSRLRSAIGSMSNETLRYKGIWRDRDSILNWLGQLQSAASAN